MSILTKETGEIILIDGSLDDLFKGLILRQGEELPKSIPFYHPKCEKFEIKVGARCRFHVDEIGGYIMIPPHVDPDDTFILPSVDRIQSIFLSVKDLVDAEKLEEFDNRVTELANIENNETVLNEVNYLENLLTTSSRTAKKKVAVDLEPA